MLIIRRIIFYLFLGIYLTLCPALLLYCFGYIINPITRSVEQTGLIYLSTIPSGANVYLGQSRFVNLTPSAIDKLDPGQYAVTLYLPGYKLWSQVVDVKAGKASAFEHVMLMPSSWNAEHLSNEPYRQLVPMPGTDYFLTARDSFLGSHFLFNWKNDTALPLVNKESPLYNFPVLSIFHENGSRALILYGGGLWERKYLYVDLKGDIVTVTDITKLLSGNPLLIQWDPQDENNIFAVYANYIDRLDVSTQALYPKFLEDVKGCGFSNNRIFLLSGDNSFKKLTLDKTRNEPFLESILFDKTVLGKNVFYHISVPNENVVFLLSEEGQLLTNVSPYQLEGKGVLGMEYNERDKALLYWTASTLKIARSVQRDDESPHKTVMVNTIYDRGIDIKQSFWMFDDAHLIFNDNDQIFLLEVEPQGINHVEFIANMKKSSSLFYTNGSGSVYYLDQGGLLDKLQVMPKENVVTEFLNQGHRNP